MDCRCQRTKGRIDFGRLGRRVIEADFVGGDSDGGLLLSRRVDHHLGLSLAAAAVIPDPRASKRICHLRDPLVQQLTGCAAVTRS